MKKQHILFTMAALCVLAACSIREDDFSIEQPRPQKGSLTISATHDNETKTTVVDGGTTVYWDTGEEIKVFNGDASGVFTSLNNAISATADFTGNLSYTSGDLLTALYPSMESATFDGDTLYTTLSSFQEGRQGSFAKNTNIAAAQSKSLKMKFMNVCGGFRFTVSRDDIVKVAFEGVGREGLAGDIAIVFEEGVPVVKRAWNLYTRVFTTPEEGDTFVPGQWYYLEMIPTTLSQGVNVTFYTADEKTGVAQSANPVSISRSVFFSKENLDLQVEQWTEEEAEPIPLQQGTMDVEIPDEYDQNYLNTLKISNFYGTFDIPSDTKGNKIVKRRARKAGGNGPQYAQGYAPLYMNAPYGVFGNGYMFHFLTDNEDNTVMCCLSKGDAPVTMTAKSTAISLLMNTPQLITSDPYEIEHIIRELETLDEFNSFYLQVDSKIRNAMKNCQSPDYSTLDTAPVIRALIGKYMQGADAADGIDLINERKDFEEKKITLKIRNHYRRVIHVYGKRAWMDNNNLVPVRTENICMSLSDALRELQNTKVGDYIGANKVDADDVKEATELVEDVINNFKKKKISLEIPFPFMMEPRSANYWKIVGGSMKFWDPDKSTPFESTSGDLEFDLKSAGNDKDVADKLILDVYGIGRFENINSYSDEDKVRMLIVLIHGVVNDFIMPIFNLATGIESMSNASGTDTFNYDLRYGARNAPLQALGEKLMKNCPRDKIYSKIKSGKILEGIIDAADYTFKEIWGNNNSDDKRTYHNLLYNCFKNITHKSSIPEKYRKSLKKLWNDTSHAVNANFIGATINTSEALLDLAGAFAAAFNSDFKTRFVRDLDPSTYLTDLMPSSGSVIRGKQIDFSWDIHMGNRVGGVVYDLQLQFVNGYAATVQSYENIVGTSYSLNLEGLPSSITSGTVKYKIIAHHPNASADSPYASSDWIPIHMIDYIKPSEAVDLGLSVKWSSSNLGAASATDAGDYYAWGETTPKTSFTWENYTFGHGASSGAMTVYNPTDGLTILLPEHDAVHKLKGSHWRMPTDLEWAELKAQCTWTEVCENGVLLGYDIVSKKNGNMIYLPVTGYKNGSEFKDENRPRYWLSSRGAYVWTGRNLNESNSSYSYAGDDRYLGMPIRGVYDDSYLEVTPSSIVDLALPSGIKWAGYNLGATKCEELGDYIAWGELDAKESYDWNGYHLGSGASTAQMDKYNPVDGLTYLMREDDAAYQRLGGPYWRMPTIEEWSELKTKCVWQEITVHGRRGYLVKSPRNGNAIFLPFSGYIDGTQLKDGMRLRYWSSSRGAYVWTGRNLFESNSSYSYAGDDRYLGMPIRAVYDEAARKFSLTEGDYVDMGLPDVEWASSNLGATSKEDIGDYYAWGETVTKNEFSWENYSHGHGASSGSINMYNNTDGLTCLMRENDAVYEQYGANHRIPTKEEWSNLWNHCEPEEKIINGRRGILLTSKINGNKLFLPFTGFMDGAQLKDGMKPRYWSSSRGAYVWTGRNLNESNSSYSYAGDDRYLGMPIRGVRVKGQISVAYAEMVDLGLSVKWASCNEGSTSPEDRGSYLAWGETVSKPEFTWENYSHGHGASSGSINMYNHTDGLTILLPEHDAVQKLKGGHWRMPTKAEWNELESECDWTLTELNNIRGYVISSRQNGNSIFLPTGGYIDGEQLKDGMRLRYWSSSRGAYVWTGRNLNESNSSYSFAGDDRYLGMLVRAVYDNAVETELTHGEYIDMGVSVLWARCNIGSSKPYETGRYYGWGEVNTHSSYTWEHYKYGHSSSSNAMEKYNYTDQLTILESTDDAAYHHSGGAQRIPTIEEWQELYSYTTQEEKICNGHVGLVFTSTVNGNKLFLPFTGFMDGAQLKDGMKPRYWSSSRGAYVWTGRNLNESNSSYSFAGDDRYLGMPIRGVKN